MSILEVVLWCCTALLLAISIHYGTLDYDGMHNVEIRTMEENDKVAIVSLLATFVSALVSIHVSNKNRESNRFDR